MHVRIDGNIVRGTMILT